MTARVADPRPVVIGIGNPYRRDDGVGPAVVELLRERHLANVTLAESDGEAAALILLWDARRLAILVDAVRADPPHPGRVHRLRVTRPRPGVPAAVSSHTGDLGDAVELARELDRLPARLLVYAVEAADTDHGLGLSPCVAQAASHIADEIATEVGEQPPTTTYETGGAGVGP